jgi:hypothetical protein
VPADPPQQQRTAGTCALGCRRQRSRHRATNGTAACQSVSCYRNPQTQLLPKSTAGCVHPLVSRSMSMQRFARLACECTTSAQHHGCAGAKAQKLHVRCSSKAVVAFLAIAFFIWAGLRRSDIAAIRSKAHICDSTSLGELGMERLIPSLDAAASEGTLAYSCGCIALCAVGMCKYVYRPC